MVKLEEWPVLLVCNYRFLSDKIKDVKKLYPYIITACAFMLMFVNVGFPSTSFGVYQPYLIELEGVSHSGGSLIVTTRTLSSLITTLFVAVYYKKLNCRIGIFIGTIITAIGFLTFSFANNLFMCCLGAFVSGIGYSLGGPAGMTILIGNWYKKHSSVAIAIATIGSSVAGIFLPMIALHIIENYDLSSSFLLQTITAFAIAIILFVAIRNNPKDINSIAVGSNESNSSKRFNDEPLPKISKTQYRLFVFGVFLLGAIGLTGIMFLSVHYSTYGANAQLAATIVSICSIFLCIGKFVSGFLFDVFGTKKGTLITFVVWFIGVVLLCLTPGTDDVFYYLAAALFGWGASLTTVGIAKWSLDLSALKGREKTVRDFQIWYAAGGFATGMLPGLIAEFAGNYTLYYILSAAAVAVAAVVVFFTYPSKNK